MSNETPEITVILNCFKRISSLEGQIESVLAQTVKVKNIFIWNNGKPITSPKPFDKVMIANNSVNLGVWSRFAYALNADTEYVCVLDDDTFPNKNFFKNCLNEMKVEPALYGARGLRFKANNRYHPFSSFGWDNPNEIAEVVDIVGHAWFFKREWLSCFWRELPPLGATRLVGEDMHFSFMLQKHLGIRTIVPPHPKSDLSQWGSDPSKAFQLGTSKEAISQNFEALKKFDNSLKMCVSNGFKLYKDLEGEKEKIVVIGPGLRKFTLLKKIVKKFPRIEKICKRLISKLEEKNIHI